MADARMRPQLQFSSSCDPESALRQLSDALGSTEEAVTGKVFPDSAVLKIPPAEVHLWTPQLQVSVEPEGDSGSVIHGLLGPRPSVWSLFIASYSFFGFLGVMGVIIGLSQMSLGQPSYALWSGPISILAVLATFMVARVGRKIGRPQSIRLKTFLENTLSNCN